MSANPHPIIEYMPLEEVVRMMERYRIKRLPVVRQGRLVGIVSRANIMHALMSSSLDREASASSSNDLAIREQILAECERQSWAPRVNLVVHGGVVELHGRSNVPVSFR
jgi:predicted transcriptional regulator